MQNPTHFIEVWKDYEGNVKNTDAMPLSYLDHFITITKRLSSTTTIAVWLIKYKEVPNV